MISDIILFAEDWERSNAYPHLTTTNRSFVHLARLLKGMGIKNHMFFLALVDQRLKEVDPFSPSITDEEIGLICQEISINPWYFFREVARAPGQSGAKARMLEGNRGNIGLFWNFFNHVMTLLIQIRQTGKSFNSDILATYLLQVICRDTQINLLTKDETLRRANIQRLKDIMDALPRYIDQRTKNDANNTEIITINKWNNRFLTHLPQASEKLAGNVGRGLTSPIFFVDEPPFQPNIQEALPAALAGGSKARELAAEADQPHGTVLTTTAGKKDTKEGAFIFSLMNDMAPWTEAFYDAKNREHLYEMIVANSRGSKTKEKIRVNITLNHNQLGKDDAWLQKTIAESVATGDKADRDFFNRWTAGTATNPLSIATLEKLRASEREPTYREISETGGYITNWFIPQHEIEQRMNRDETLVVFDTSEASGGDDISMRVTNMRTGQPYASGTYNNTNIITFSEWVCSWVTRWSKTTMLVERRSTGVAVLDMMLLLLPAKNIDPFERLFNRVVNNPEEHKDVWEMVKEPMWRRPSDFYDLNKRHFGFATSGSGLTSRASLYGQILHSAANQVGHLVYDKKTIDQIASLITKNGRVDHPPGEHDDMCFVGDTLVRTIDGNKPIKDIKLGDLVLTRKGYYPVVKLFRSQKTVITKYGLTGTPNHPFITPGGEVEFQDVQPETEVYVWNEKQSSIEVKRIIDTLDRPGYNTGNTSIDTTSGSLPLSLCTDRCTKTITVPSHQGIMCTTGTTTISITTPTTWKLSHQGSISKDTTQAATTTPKKSANAVEKFLQNGIAKTKSGLSKLLGRTAQPGAKPSQSGNETTQSLQDKHTQPLVAKHTERQTVYNLMVEECHEYFVNDILVHNCIGWILSHWFMTKATNLKHYGIDSNAILQDVRQFVNMSAVDRLKAQQQTMLKTRAKELIEKIKEGDDDTLIRMHEQELRMVYTRLQAEEGERVSVDQLINDIREERVRKRTTQRHAPTANTYRQERTYNERAQRIAESQARNFNYGNVFNQNARTRFF